MPRELTLMSPTLEQHADWRLFEQTNFSTAEMRAPGGITAIEAAITKLSLNHAKHLLVYGTDNEQCLTGKHETASMTSFSSGVANRGCSIRIPRSVAAEGRGYFEDRRPASNCDPYQVTAIVAETCLL